MEHTLHVQGRPAVSRESTLLVRLRPTQAALGLPYNLPNVVTNFYFGLIDVPPVGASAVPCPRICFTRSLTADGWCPLCAPSGRFRSTAKGG